MDFRERNFTRELMSRRNDPADIVIEIAAGHWSKLGAIDRNKVADFLAEIGVIARDFEPLDEARFPAPKLPTRFQKHGIPFLTKSCC